MLACLSVTLCAKGATVRISRRVWLTGTGALAASMIAAACLAAPAVGGIHPPPGASAAVLAGTARTTTAAVLAGTARTTTAGVLAAAPASASGAVPTALAGPMVALGASYTAGALLPINLRARPLGCLRSTKGYPLLVAGARGAGRASGGRAAAGGGG